MYLAEISDELAAVLLDLANEEPPQGPPARSEAPEELAQEEQELANLAGRTDIGETERAHLVKARRGQGVFKANVRMNEWCCRVTGVADPVHLHASHIKPWKDSDDAEKVRV